MPGNPLTDPDWAANLTNTIDRYVGLVRDNATVRVVKIVRLVVFGLLVAVVGIIAAVLASVVGLRLLQNLLTTIFSVGHGSAVWISYVAVGTLFLLAGAFVMRSRHTRHA